LSEIAQKGVDRSVGYILLVCCLRNPRDKALDVTLQRA